jgi:hypothetical protein
MIDWIPITKKQPPQFGDDVWGYDGGTGKFSVGSYCGKDTAGEHLLSDGEYFFPITHWSYPVGPENKP